MSDQKQPRVKRVGIRGFEIKTDGIVYAESTAAALRKLGRDLLRVADENEQEDEAFTQHDSVFARGGMRVKEIGRA